MQYDLEIHCCTRHGKCHISHNDSVGRAAVNLHRQVSQSDSSSDSLLVFMASPEEVKIFGGWSTAKVSTPIVLSHVVKGNTWKSHILKRGLFESPVQPTSKWPSGFEDKNNEELKGLACLG